MDERAVEAALSLDAAWVGRLRAAWLHLIDLATWGDVRCARLGASGRLRKRVLETGERLKSLAGPRDWIPHPRERVKSALAAALNLRESLAALAQAAREAEAGADAAAFAGAVADLQRAVDARLGTLETLWAELLDGQYREAPGD
jgi:hypothetical protein